MDITSLFKDSALGPRMLEGFERARAGFADIRDSVVRFVKPAAAANRHLDFMIKAAANVKPFTGEDLDKLLGIYFHDDLDDIWSVRQTLFSLYQNFPDRALLPIVDYSEAILRSSRDSDQILDALELLRMMANDLASSPETRTQAKQIFDNVKDIATNRPNAEVRSHYNAVFANFTLESPIAVPAAPKHNPIDNPRP